MKIGFAFLIWIFNILVLISFNGIAGDAEMGPYKTTPLSANPCTHPPKPYEKEPGMTFSTELYTSGKKTLLRGNLTVLKVDPKMRVSIRGFIIEEGKFNVMYIANSVGCNGVLVRALKMALNVQNHKNCVPKGIYTFNDLDFNAVQQMWSKSQRYGKYQWKISISSKTGTTLCMEFNTVTEPLVSE